MTNYIFKYTSILLFLLIGFAVSQERIDPRNESAEEEVKSTVFDVDLLELPKSNESYVPQHQLLEQVLDQAIDSTTYVLGPGDQLLIQIWGVLEIQYPIQVTPDGHAVIPTVGEVRVAEKTLAEASKLIRAELKSSYRNSTFSVRLYRLRKFRVFVVGDVVNPGSYFLRAVDRLSDAIQLAGGVVNWGDDTRIQVKHADETVSTVNVSEFYLTGDMTENPMLNGGDVIYVPPIDLRENYVVLEGNVGVQGIYQTRPNEALFDFLSRQRAINRLANIEEVLLIRGDDKRYFNLFEVESGARTEILQTADRIMVPTTRRQVYVKGEVYQPGAYPYFANYSAVDYAGFAGMTEEAKGPESIVVIREGTQEVIEGGDVLVFNGDIVVVKRLTRETVKDYLAIFTPLISLGLSIFAISQATKN